MLSIQTNVNSLVAQQNLNVNSQFQAKTIQQLTSGYRINQSGDDAAGLAVANKFRSGIAELTQGVANGNDGLAQLQIMDGGMNNIGQMLDRLKTLATQSASGTFTGVRADLNSEFQTVASEIDRQAQSIGLNSGGSFAKSLSVYIGSGSGSQSVDNSKVTFDLTSSTVDTQSLGLKGYQVVAGGQDIGIGSATHTVSQILNNSSNATASAGYTTFYLSGPGFSDNAKINLAVSTQNVADINSLVTNINAAIASQAASNSALKNADIVASVNTDASGGKELAFTSGTTAFQVQAGDQMANALMGNFSSGSTGAAIFASVVGGQAAAGTTGFLPYSTGVAVQISGAGLANPVNISFNSNDTTVAAAINDLTTQIKNNSQLQLAGISLDQAKDTAPLTFTSSSGQTFSVLATGDTANYLGLGTFANASATSAPTYTSMLGLSVASSDTGNGLSTLAFSLNGGATGTAASVTGTAVAAGYADTSTNHTLALSIDGTSVSLEFNNDTNKSTQESLSNIVSFINSQIQSTLGLSSDVNLASLSSNAITISGRSADRLGTVGVTAANLSAALGLTVNNSTNHNAATVDTITSGTITAGQANTTGFAGTKILALVVDGTAVSVDFNNDPNKAGTESVANVANYINTTVQRTLGWGHDVTVAAAGATSLTLTAPTTGHTVSINSGGSEATVLTGLSLTGAGFTAITGSGSALNTVTLNLAGGDATGGLLVGTAATPATVNTAGAGNSFAIAVNGQSITVNFTNDGASAATESIANIVTYMNSTIQKALGTSANLVSVDAAGKIEIASPDKGADTSVSIATASAFTFALKLTTDATTANTGTNGAGPTAASVANMLGYGFQANSSLQKAGFQATVTGGQIQITSNGTEFRVDAWGTVTNGKNSDVGFGHTGLGFAGTVAGPSRVNVFDAGGVSATPASGISFLPMLYGNDTQAITISTNDVSGVMQAKTITLQNNGTAQTGANLDSTVSYINSILQQSNNSTLQRIMAVKENVGGTEAIRFVSSLNAFQVSVGASPNGLGVNGGLPETVTSALNGSASTADIGSQQGAAQAVIAVGAAVTKLGSAQAAVGKGQNQLTYAISLAQSQITNFSAAESYIRDANVAQQAANLTKAQVLQQASIAAMAQANSAPQAVLALLRG